MNGSLAGPEADSIWKPAQTHPIMSASSSDSELAAVTGETGFKLATKRTAPSPISTGTPSRWWLEADMIPASSSSCRSYRPRWDRPTCRMYRATASLLDHEQAASGNAVKHFSNAKRQRAVLANRARRSLARKQGRAVTVPAFVPTLADSVGSLPLAIDPRKTMNTTAKPRPARKTCPHGGRRFGMVAATSMHRPRATQTASTLPRRIGSGRFVARVQPTLAATRRVSMTCSQPCSIASVGRSTDPVVLSLRILASACANRREEIVVAIAGFRCRQLEN